VVASVLTAMRAASITESARHRLLLVYTLPIEPTGLYSSPYLLPGRAIPTVLARRGSYQVFGAVFWRGARDNLAVLRDRLGLPPQHGNALAGLRRRPCRPCTWSARSCTRRPPCNAAGNPSHVSHPLGSLPGRNRAGYCVAGSSRGLCLFSGPVVFWSLDLRV
jgi:hypothetical protein